MDTNKARFLRYIAALFVVFVGIQFIQPFELRVRIVDSFIFGLAIALLPTLFGHLFVIARQRKGLFGANGEGFLSLGLTSGVFFVGMASVWWLVYREIGRPEWMREAAIYWRFGMIFSGTMIFFAAQGIETTRGFIVPPPAWFKFWMVTGFVVAALLSIIVLVRWQYSPL